MKNEQKANWASMSLLALLCVAAFGNAMTNEFVFDDRATIVDNDLIKGLNKLPVVFVTGYWAGAGGFYRPLPIATYAVNYAIGGLDPSGYHLVNLLLHLGVCAALYLLMRRLGCSWGAATAAAALFAVHPIHTEAVTGVVGRAELLMSLGVLFALGWHIQGSAAGRPQMRLAVASWVAFALALLSKEQALMLPAVLVVYDISIQGRQRRWTSISRNALIRYAGYFVVLMTVIVLRITLVGHSLSHQVSFIDNPLAHFRLVFRLLTAVKIAGKYLWLCVWPHYLSADYSYNAIPISVSALEPRVLASLLAWGGLLGLAAWSFFRGTRQAFFAVGFTLLTFLPTSNLLLSIGTIMGERLFYLPSAGLVVLVAFGWDAIVRNPSGGTLFRFLRQAGLVIFASVLIVFTVRTVLRNRDWQNEVSLFQSALQVVPGSAKMHYGLGNKKNDLEEALREYGEALRIYPDYAKTDSAFAGFFGSALLEKGRLDEAVAVLERAVLLGSKREEVYYNLGFGYTKQKRWEEAEKAYGRAIVLDSQDPAPRNGLSFVLHKEGRDEEALEVAEQALRIKPDFWEAHYNQARALDALGRVKEAADAHKRALQLRPLHAVNQRLE